MAKHRKNDGPWRVNCLVKRGAYCRACGSTQHLEMDHIWPRGQQGPSIVENGLALCGAWGSCGAHALKTAGQLLIERAWLDPDQIEWLAEVGWVEWDDETGAVSGGGWRHFAPIDPTSGQTRERTREELHITPPLDPWAPGDTVLVNDVPHRVQLVGGTPTFTPADPATTNQEADMAPEDTDTDIPVDDEGFADPGLAAVPDAPDDLDDGLLPEDDLAGAADAAMADDPEPQQDSLPGTDYARMKFVGMAWETPERPGLKEEVEFQIRGKCVGHTEEVMADGTIRELAKIKVDSIVRVNP